MAKSSVNGEYMGTSSLNGESFIGMFDYQRAQLVCPALHLPSFGALLSCGWRKVRALQVVRHLAISPWPGSRCQSIVWRDHCWVSGYVWLCCFAVFFFFPCSLQCIEDASSLEQLAPRSNFSSPDLPSRQNQPSHNKITGSCLPLRNIHKWMEIWWIYERNTTNP